MTGYNFHALNNVAQQSGKLAAARRSSSIVVRFLTLSALAYLRTNLANCPITVSRETYHIFDQSIGLRLAFRAKNPDAFRNRFAPKLAALARRPFCVSGEPYAKRCVAPKKDKTLLAPHNGACPARQRRRRQRRRLGRKARAGSLNSCLCSE